MIHKLKDLDTEGFLKCPAMPEKPCPQGNDCSSCAYMDGVKETLENINILGIEWHVEEIAKTIQQEQCRSDLISTPLSLAQSIANNPKCFKLVTL